MMAEVPLGVVTVTSTVPVPDGTVTVRLEAVTEEIPVPAAEPKWTAVAPVKPVPLTVTVFVPRRRPVVRADPGDCRERVVGVGARERSWTHHH